MLVLAGDTERLEGRAVTGPLEEEVMVPAVERNPFINLRSFCRFFLPPGPDQEQLRVFTHLIHHFFFFDI